MPIYAYKCESCGHAKDVLQKMTDAPLSDCPVCGKPNFKKQLTAAGFQLKGNGWYATDFKGGSGGTAAPAVPATSEGGTAVTPNAPASPAASPAPSTPAADSGSASATSSSACAPSCACH
jgi:putative FmdB family regulatory protein